MSNLISIIVLVFVSLTRIATPAAAPVTDCVSQGVGMFNNCATLDASVVKIHIPSRPDFDAAVARCMQTGRWTLLECHVSVAEGEF